jgi:nucleotide-binding universal stress UspA family protein
MALKNLLLNLDDTKDCPKRIEAAFALAAEHGAHLNALYVMPEATMPPYLETQVPRDATREYHERLEAHGKEVLEDFRKQAKRAGIGFETRLSTGPEPGIPQTVALHARYTDLAIVGQANEDDPPPGGTDTVEEVAFAAGRPVLAIPYIGAPKQNGQVRFGRRIMVAWDAGREATRAVNDALPFLERADAVSVICVNPRQGYSGHGEEPGADIALHLSRHDVKVQVEHVEVRDIEVGDTILSRLADESSDMLVMGCYGHSRLREMVLGGVTRDVLQHMTVPVLLSH